MHHYEILFRQNAGWDYAGHKDGPVHIERNQPLKIDDILNLNGALVIVDVIARGASGVYACVASVEPEEED